jgi:uncharacterized protein (TIGR02099 family)
MGLMMRLWTKWLGRWSRFSERWARRCLQGLGLGLAVACILASVLYFGLRYWAMPSIDRWRPQIVEQLERSLGVPVAIQNVQASLIGWQPQLNVQGVTLGQNGEPPWLAVNGATARLSWRSLLAWSPRLAALQVEGVSLRIERDPDGVLIIAGQRLGNEGPDDGRALRALLQQRNVDISNVDIMVTDRMGQWAAGRQIAVRLDRLQMHGVGRVFKATTVLGATAVAGGPTVLAAGRLVLDATRDPSAPVDRWASWRGQIYAGSEGLDLAALQKSGLVGVDAEQDSFKGLLEAQGWLRFAKARWNDVDFKLAGRDIEGPWRHAADVDLDGRIETQWSEQHRPWVPERVNLTFAKARAELKSSQGAVPKPLALDPGAQVSLDSSGQVRAVRVAVSQFDVGPWVQWIRGVKILPASARTWLTEAQLSGQLLNLQVAAEKSEAWRYTLSTRFKDLALQRAPSDPRPSIATVSGDLALSEHQGDIRMQARDAVLRLPSFFEQPDIALAQFEAQAQWNWVEAQGQRGAHWAVRLDQVNFANEDAAGELSGMFRTLPIGPGEVDLKASFSRAKANAAARYLPKRLPESTRFWVANAIKEGEIDKADLRLVGDLWEFPFHDATPGVFQVEAQVRNARVAYAPDWPEITEARATVRFNRDSLEIVSRAGKIYDVNITESRLRIADFRSPLLLVEGSGSGPAQDMVRFVNSSPIAARIDEFTAQTDVKGDARFQVNLSVPLMNVANSGVQGRIFFMGNRVALDKVLPPFDDVTGSLEFSDQGLRLKDINASFLGGDLKVQGQTRGPSVFELQAQGAITAQGIRGQLDNALTRELAGQTRYSATLEVRQKQTRLQITSDLVGLASRLPEPFNKPAQAAWPLQVSSEPLRSPRGLDESQRSLGDLITVSLNDKTSVLVERKRDAKAEKLLIQRAALAVDLPALLPETGFSVAYQGAKLQVDDWIPILVNDVGTPATTKPSVEFAPSFSLLPSLVVATAQELVIRGKTLNQVVFGATRNDDTWAANVAARQLNGYFTWKAALPGQPVGSLRARFARLEIPEDRVSDFETLIDQSPDVLPNISLQAEQFLLAGKSLGSLSLQAINAGSEQRPIWRLEQLRLEHPHATLSATGQWALPRGALQRRTELEFDLTLRDSGALLDELGLEKVLRDGAGSIKGQIGWMGSPVQLHYPSMTGQLRLELGKGQFLKTDPGIARLIGVLNLQSLPRRLALDFTDVFSEGFSFDEMESEVRVESGIAKTDSTRMRGTAARVNLTGAVDLARETQELHVEVRPVINAGTASLVYGALINPAIGLGTIIAQAILRRPLEEAFTVEYEVKGSWSEPAVREIPRAQRNKD